MIYVESFLISALIFVGGYCTFFDIKKGIIPNIVIFIGTVGALIGNVILFMLSGVEQLPIFLLHIVSASVIAVLMYLLRIWAGGDVKLFVLLSALTPVECLKHRIPLPAIMIFIGAFSFTFLFLVVQSVVFLIKKEGHGPFIREIDRKTKQILQSHPFWIIFVSRLNLIGSTHAT